MNFTDGVLDGKEAGQIKDGGFSHSMMRPLRSPADISYGYIKIITEILKLPLQGSMVLF